MRISIFNVGRDKTISFIINDTNPFGGMKRRSLGIDIDTGSTGSTYGDNRQNLHVGVSISVWRWIFSLKYNYKEK